MQLTQLTTMRVHHAVGTVTTRTLRDAARPDYNSHFRNSQTLLDSTGIKRGGSQPQLNSQLPAAPQRACPWNERVRGGGGGRGGGGVRVGTPAFLGRSHGTRPAPADARDATAAAAARAQ